MFRKKRQLKCIVFSFITIYSLLLLRDKMTYRSKSCQHKEEIAAEMSRRLGNVESVCKAEGLGRFKSSSFEPTVSYPPTPLFESFYFDRWDGLAWCPIYKAASTSWIFNFCKLGDVDPSARNSSESVSDVARKIWPSLSYDEGNQAFDDAKMKFFIVRHPFERLVSAYRDKLENITGGLEHGTIYYYEKYGAKIVKKYRQKLRKRKAYSKIAFPNSGEPTFEEFVFYLNDINLAQDADDHWRPYYLSCTPCSLQFNAIVKFETMEDDQKYIIGMANLEDKIEPTWEHITRGNQSSSLTKQYLDTIPKLDLQKLYEKYRLDFEMFEYSKDLFS